MKAPEPNPGQPQPAALNQGIVDGLGGTAIGGQVPCRELRSKEMYYQSPGQTEDSFSSGLGWCARTQDAIGPDGAPVGRSECCAGRKCYVE